MLLKTAYRNAGAYSDLVKDTNFLGIKLDHEFNRPARAIITMKDEDGSIAQKYGNTQKIALDGAVEDNGGVQTDETTEANSAAVNDMTLTPAGGGEWSINDAYYFGFPEKVNGFTLNVGTPLVLAAADPVTAWEYWDGDSWETLSDISDGSNMYKNSGEVVITWTIPGDWATTTVNSQGPFYYVRQRVTTAADITTQGLGTQAWYDTIYDGPGAVSYEDPDSTSKFEGRIVSTQHNMNNKRLTIFAEDWSSQLDGERFDYELREDIDGSGLRQSTTRSDPDSGVVVAPVHKVTTNYYMYDDSQSWAADAFNGKFLVFTAGMAGKITIDTGPYDETVSIVLDSVDSPANGEENVWLEDSNYHEMEDTTGNDWYVRYSFRTDIENSPLFVANSISDISVKIVYALSSVSGNPGTVSWFCMDKTLGCLVQQLYKLDNSGDIVTTTIKIPAEYWDEVLDGISSGVAGFRIQIGVHGATKTLKVYQVRVLVECLMQGSPSAFEILDTTGNVLKIDTDLTNSGIGIQEGIPYSIVDFLYTHINGLVTDGDDLMTMTTSVESTSGLSTRHYINRTRWEMIRDILKMDKAVAWVVLGTKQLTYKSTFNDGVPAAITDADVISWDTGGWNSKLMRNEAHVSGIRIGDNQLLTETEDLSPDPGVDSKALYGLTQTAIVTNTGTMTQYDTTELGRALVERDEDIPLLLTAEIAGLSTHELGHEVSITSTYLGLTAQVYVVTKFSWDSMNYRTTLRLHPRGSNGFVERVVFGEKVREVTEATEEQSIDTLIADLTTQRWT